MIILELHPEVRGESRTSATSKMEHFMIIKCWKPLTIITKSSILGVAAVLDPQLHFLLLILICSADNLCSPCSIELIYTNAKINLRNSFTILSLFPMKSRLVSLTSRSRFPVKFTCCNGFWSCMRTCCLLG